MVSFKAAVINLFINTLRKGVLEFDVFFTNRLKELSTQYQKEILWECSLVGNLFLSKINNGLFPSEKHGFKLIIVGTVYYMGGCCSNEL